VLCGEPAARRDTAAQAARSTALGAQDAAMSKTVQSSQLMDPFLIDVVDEEWMRDTLPDDGASARIV